MCHQSPFSGRLSVFLHGHSTAAPKAFVSGSLGVGRDGERVPPSPGSSMSQVLNKGDSDPETIAQLDFLLEKWLRCQIFCSRNEMF